MTLRREFVIYSQKQVQIYKKNIQIENSGKYYLSLLWMPSLSQPIGKVFGVSMNSVLVANITATDGDYVDHLSEFILDLNSGTNTLDIVHYPDGSDTNGANLG